MLINVQRCSLYHWFDFLRVSFLLSSESKVLIVCNMSACLTVLITSTLVIHRLNNIAHTGSVPSAFVFLSSLLQASELMDNKIAYRFERTCS